MNEVKYILTAETNGAVIEGVGVRELLLSAGQAGL